MFFKGFFVNSGPIKMHPSKISQILYINSWPTGRGNKQFFAPLMETPSLECVLGEIAPKWHHVLTQAITRSSGQDTLEKNFLDSRACQQRYPPKKKHKNFHYLEGVSTELQDSFEKTKANFHSPSNE